MCMAGGLRCGSVDGTKQVIRSNIFKTDEEEEFLVVGGVPEGLS